MASAEAKQLFQVVKEQVAPLFSVEVPLAQQRTTFEGMGAQAVIPEGVSFEELHINNVPCDKVIPKEVVSNKTVLFFHGGGNAMGSPKSYRGLTSRIAEAANCQLIAPDFRLVPEHAFPANVDDALAAYEGLLDSGVSADKIVLGGDSSGGGMVLALMQTLKAKNLPMPKAGFLYSPWTDATSSGESFYGNKELDPWITPELMLHNAEQYAGETAKDNPLVSPLLGDLSDLPPLLVHVGSHEILKSDAVRLVEKVKEAGGEVEFKEWEDLWHVFQFFAPALPEANSAIAETAAFVNN